MVSFKAGKITIRISGHPAKTLSKEISEKTSTWTGMKWQVIQVEKGGDETIDGEKLKNENEKIELANNSEEMEKVLKAFPNAKLKNVTDMNNHKENEYNNFDNKDEEEI